MTFFEEMRATVVELLGPGEDSFGEDAIARRPGAGYDPETRSATAGDELVMHMRGTFDSSLSPVAQGEGLTKRHQRVFFGYPALAPGDTEFEPEAADTLQGDGRTWKIMEAAPIRKQGVLLGYELGLAV